MKKSVRPLLVILVGFVVVLGCAGTVLTPVPTPVTGITGRVTAGPTCPVVTEPPDPSCADRPVVGAVLAVTDEAGVEVARVGSAADGPYSLSLAPGRYRIAPQPVEGLMGTAPAADVAIERGTETLHFAYDTGIR